MTKSVFVTATGTDIGKTYVSALLVKKMRDLGLNCGYYKPALSGAYLKNGKLVPGDAEFVVNTANLDIAPSSCVTYCFEEAVSPHLAAIRQRVNIDIAEISRGFNRLKASYDYMVVEGAGGITCPFRLDEETILLPDVIRTLGLEILLVADGGLGTINSVLLTVEYAKTQRLNILGIILNNYDKNNFMHVDNRVQVERLTGIKVLATVAEDDKSIDIDEGELLKLFAPEV